MPWPGLGTLGQATVFLAPGVSGNLADRLDPLDYPCFDDIGVLLPSRHGVGIRSPAAARMYMNDMGHPPPSPALSMDGLVPLEQIMGATTSVLASSEVMLSYTQHHARHHAGLSRGELSAYNDSCRQPSQDAHTPPPEHPEPEEPAGGFHGVAGGAGCHHQSLAHAPFTPETSPPAPADTITTRSGSGIARRACPGDSRRARRPRAETKRKLPKHREASILLKRPLSEVAKESCNGPVFDVAAHVHRPVEVRREEASEEDKVKRPLNAFLLYRKALSGLAKELLKKSRKGKEDQRNQQLVSRLCGDSWKMEPDEVKSKFRRLAEVERSKHAEAFPRYKYTPRPGKRQKSGRDEPAANDAGAGCSVSSTADAREPGQVGHDSRPAAETEAGPQQGAHSHWCPPWCPSGSQPWTGLYPGQQLHYPEQQGLGPWPMADFGYVGPPGDMAPAGSYETQRPTDAYLGALPCPSSDLCIDPSLLPRAGEPVYQWLPCGDALDGPREAHDSLAVLSDWDIDGAHNAYLRGGQQDWKVEQLDEVSHFNDWMAQQENAVI